MTETARMKTGHETVENHSLSIGWLSLLSHHSAPDDRDPDVEGEPQEPGDHEVFVVWGADEQWR